MRTVGFNFHWFPYTHQLCIANLGIYPMEENFCESKNVKNLKIKYLIFFEKKLHNLFGQNIFCR